MSRHSASPSFALATAIRVRLFSYLLAVGALQGCVVDRESTSVSPDVNLSHLKKLYVAKFAPDGRGVNDLIALELRKMGFEVSTGPDIPEPKDVDAIVTYRDRWRWDITMYMLELRIFIRDPKTDGVLAVGNSYHGTLSRKSPEEMVAEVLSNIFGKVGRASKAEK
jgi:hypothetical protein